MENNIDSAISRFFEGIKTQIQQKTQVIKIKTIINQQGLNN
jgi:hypothetical protein